MSFTKLIMVYKDSITFTLVEADLTGMQFGDKLKTWESDVPHSNGLKWWIEYYPAGLSSLCSNNLSVFLNVNKAVSAKYTFKVDCSPIQTFCTFDFVKAQGYGSPSLASHDALRPLFVNGLLSITCEAEFNVCMPFTFLKPSLAQYCDHVDTDFVFLVGSDRVQVHKSLLTLISPVFHAMLFHDTAESRSGKVEILDFDFKTIKTVFDYCYGRELETLSVDTVYDMLRFADKYDIKAVTKIIEELPHLCMTVDNFPAIIRFACDYSMDNLFDNCCEFFKEHQKDIVKTEKFAMLAPALLKRLLKQTFDLKTEFDVLRHAHANETTFILDPLEPPILESLSLETFCDTVKYAFECSRDTLMKACAKFFNEHSTEIIRMEDFVDLSPSAVQGVMKLSLQEPQKKKNSGQIVSNTMEPEKVTVQCICFICYVYYFIVESIAKIFHFN